MSRIEYRPEIDGLRAVAVIPVLLFHIERSILPGGFIGVDVFFVISGFLITSILRRDMEEGTFSFRDFWARRVRRIFPAMIFVTACTLAFTYVFVFRPEQQMIGQQALAALLSVANIYFCRSDGDYWGTAAEESPFLHAWSLSVEEQFYLCFPIAMWLIFRFRRRWLPSCIAVIAVGSLALFLRGGEERPVETFYLLPTRVWELCTGCLLAVSQNDKSSGHSGYGIFATVGLSLIILSYFFFETLGGGLGLAVVGAACIISFGQIGSCNRILSLRPLVHIGRISYALYLWHWPVLVLAEAIGVDWDGPSDKLLLAVATYVLAVCTYLFIEKPTRGRPGIVVPIFVSAMAVGVAALCMAVFPRVYTAEDGFVTPVERIGVYDIHPITSSSKSRFRNGGIVSLRGAPRPDLVLLGDSHAVCCAHIIDEIAERNRISTAFYAMSGSDPFCKIPPRAEQRRARLLSPDLQLEVDETLLKYLAEWQPRVVVISCRWEHVDEKQAHQFLEWLSEQQIRVLLLEDPPYIAIPQDRNAMKIALYSGMRYTGGRKYWPVKNSSTNDIAHRFAGKFQNVDIIPVQNVYMSGQSALLFDDRDVVYDDDDHLTISGVRLAVVPMEEAIVQATAEVQGGLTK